MIFLVISKPKSDIFKNVFLHVWIEQEREVPEDEDIKGGEEKMSSWHKKKWNKKIEEGMVLEYNHKDISKANLISFRDKPYKGL
jgi:hypothetical protein